MRRNNTKTASNHSHGQSQHTTSVSTILSHYTDSQPQSMGGRETAKAINRGGGYTMAYTHLATMSRMLWDEELPQPITDKLELWDMQGAVIDRWIENSTSFEQIDRVSDEPLMEFRALQGWADDVLASPELMLIELGYQPGDYASYIADTVWRD